MNTLRTVVFSALALLLTSSFGRAADGAAPLTPEDLQGYYGGSFTVARDDKPDDPVKKGGGQLYLLTFIGTGPDLKAATLLVRQSDSAEAAQKAAQAVKDEYGKMGIKIADAPGVGDYAFFFGSQLVFAKGSQSFILAAPGLKKEDDMAETHTATTALAQKIVERLK